jgi:hypothetical protein
MAYTLTYSIGTITVIDTTLNTQTSLSLPGRNYAGYGQPVDQNQISLLENFASYPVTGPANAIPGQTWFDSDSVTFNVNISTTSTANWQSLVTTGTSNTSFGNLTVTGNSSLANLTVTGNTTLANLTVTGNTTLANLTVTGNTTLANLTVTGNLTTTHITTGGNTILGDFTGNWTLTAGSKLNATYADLGERFAADDEYEAGTVMEMGGIAEITSVRDDLSDIVFGVISESAGVTMNSGAGTQSTHPTIAMTGRVPVKVIGKVSKGDRLVSAGNGRARAAKKNEATPFNTVGRSLENKLTDSEGKVLAAVSAKL